MVKFITVQELADIYGIRFSRSHRWRLEDAGLFPKAVKLGTDGATNHYVKKEVEDWIAERLAARNRRPQK